MMLPKSDVFVTLRNDGPSMDKRDKHWSKIKHRDEGVRKGNQNNVSREVFSTLKYP